MPHLDSLQTVFKEDLQVIAISSEKPTRLRRFIDATDHRFAYARDTGLLATYFPYQVIPHSVLISPDGKVVAITSPKNITSQVIRQVLRGEHIVLPQKEEPGPFDPTFDYFEADTLAQSSFQLQPNNPNLPTFSQEYGKGPFANRRLTAYNLTIDGLYRMAYQKSSLRLDLEFDESLIAWENEANRFCMDIITPDGKSLRTSLQQALNADLPYKSRLVKRQQEVVVIKTSSGEVTAEKQAPTNSYSGRGDGFTSEGATIADFCQYLENFGIFGYPVVDETGATSAYKIDFSFDPENPATFKDAMQQLGLVYTKEVREIEILVLSVEE